MVTREHLEALGAVAARLDARGLEEESRTLRDNILLGLPEDGVLPRALELAVLDRDVAAPERGVAALERGLDAVVGPRGVRLSGGQLQRAAAAQMFVREPELLVFDDRSSALDVETERALWTRLLRLRERTGTTILAVSHRPAALEGADQIVVLDAGRVVVAGAAPPLP